MAYKKYPKYKPSGVEWLGEIPEHWDVRKLKWLLEDKLKYGANELADNDDERFPRYIRITDFNESGLLNEETFKSLPLNIAKDFLLKEGDILFARSGATVGKTFIFKNYKGLACFAGYLIKATANKNIIYPEFLYYYTKSELYNEWKNAVFIQSTIQNISAEKYNILPIPLPSIPEQDQIIKFLDEKTGKINKLISKKQKMIELLKEERTAIINQAVTKGIDPNVELKDSGVAWIGRVPHHWNLKKLKYVSHVNNATLPETTDEKYEFYYIDIGSVDLEDGFKVGEKINFKEAPSRARRIAKKGDTIISTVRTYLKAIAYFEDDRDNIIVSTGFAVVTPRKNFIQKFLYYILRSEKIINRICALSVGVSYPAINSKDLSDIAIWYPGNKEEQKKIVEYLDEKTIKIKMMIKRLQTEIDYLREYRQALISEAVTGKIDIRGRVDL